MTTASETKMTKTLGTLLGSERRFITFDTDDEARSDDGALRFTGHAAVFGRRTFIGRKPHGFWESVRSGAFAKAINEGDVRLLHNHDPNLVLARSTVREGPGSLRLTEEKRGLRVEAEFVPTTYARDIHALVRAGVVSGMSFSFNPVKEEWRAGKDGEERELLEVTLPDVSTVTYPAYAETDAAARSAGMDLLLDATDLDDAQRSAILGAIRQGAVTPDVASALRAASRALAGLAETHQPGEEPTDAESDDLARRTQDIHYRMRALMARNGDYTRSTSR